MCGCESCEIVFASRSNRCADFGRRRHVRRQHLHRHRPLQPRVPRLVDLPHPARSDRRQDLVRTEPRSHRQTHVGRLSSAVISQEFAARIVSRPKGGRRFGPRERSAARRPGLRSSAHPREPQAGAPEGRRPPNEAKRRFMAEASSRRRRCWRSCPPSSWRAPSRRRARRRPPARALRRSCDPRSP